MLWLGSLITEALLVFDRKGLFSPCPVSLILNGLRYDPRPLGWEQNINLTGPLTVRSLFALFQTRQSFGKLRLKMEPLLVRCVLITYSTIVCGAWAFGAFVAILVHLRRRSAFLVLPF